MTLTEMNEKTAKIMGWHKEVDTEIKGNYFAFWVDDNGREMFDCRLRDKQYLDDEWHPTEDVEQFFMFLDHWCKKTNFYYLHSYHPDIEVSVDIYNGKINCQISNKASTLKELMPKVIEAICNAMAG